MATEQDRSAQVRVSPALEARIQSLRHTLSDKEQTVALFLRSDPKEFISLSITALAARCRVSETVIIRLYRKLGYDGFHQFKIDIAQSLTESTAEGPAALQVGDSMESIKRKVFFAARQALEDSLQGVDSENLEKARDLLLAARRVVIASFGGSAAVALDFTHKLLKLGTMAFNVPDSHMQAMAASVMGPEDVLIAITHSGNSRDIIEALTLAKQRGASTVLVTGFPYSPATQVADVCLYAMSRETKFQTDAMTSRTVQLAVLDTLYVSLIFANKERATATIHDTSVAAARKKL